LSSSKRDTKRLSPLTSLVHSSPLFPTSTEAKDSKNKDKKAKKLDDLKKELVMVSTDPAPAQAW
jgi:hypothetical protein